jgi:L-lactate dehydrogenase complex protein LldE
VGEATVRALRKLGVPVRFREAQTCCGQPAFNSGFWDDAKPLARKFLDLFEDADTDQIVVPSGSCASMIRVFYSELFQDDPADLERVKKVAPKVFELSEYLVDVLGVPGDTGFPENADAPEVSVTYHDACHLTRELGAATQARAILNALPGVELTELDQSEVCCGFGGTFAVKYADISGAMLKDKVERIDASGADVVTACDASCLMHIGGGLEKRCSKVRPKHLAELIDEALP